jgi:hypothetical protein
LYSLRSTASFSICTGAGSLYGLPLEPFALADF